MYRTQTREYIRAGLPNHTRALILVGFVVFLLFWIGCVPNQPGTNQPAPNTNQNTKTTAEAPAQPETNNQESRVPITLPVIDALLSDEAFVAEVRRTVQPTDEQLDKLKNISRDAVLKLSEDGLDDASRSTKASSTDADKQIKQILGNDGAQKFIGLARKYWAGGDITLSAKPNEIPSDTRVVVNAPAYRMDVFENGRLLKSYKIGIGYPEFPLPVGVRTADKIIFNPPWTPPDEPWVKGEFQPGKTVEAGSKKNPLGVLKIPIGLPSLIHGGKDPGRLGTFASHGCVGLTNQLVQTFSMELARITGSDLTKEKMAEYQKQRTETVEVKLAKPAPVELRYETIVVVDGKLYIFRDVYEHGTNTEENLVRVLDVYGISMNDLSPEEQAAVQNALKEMAVDAQGKPVDETDNKNAKPSTSSRVTRNVKGKKEVMVEIAALKGKGYPAPVGINP